MSDSTKSSAQHSFDGMRASDNEPTDLYTPSRREFFVLGAGSAVAGSALSIGITTPASANGGVTRDEILTGSERAADAAQVKNRAVQRQFVASRSLPRQRTNLDEIRYAGERYYGSFTKCLPQNEFGEVDEAVSNAFVFSWTMVMTPVCHRCNWIPRQIASWPIPSARFALNNRGWMAGRLVRRHPVVSQRRYRSRDG